LKLKTREMELKKTLVIDLDETLVHANFKPIMGADISKFLKFKIYSYPCQKGENTCNVQTRGTRIS
jgi:TFIIF-interacting CTD phosphatase-like protein